MHGLYLHTVYARCTIIYICVAAIPGATPGYARLVSAPYDHTFLNRSSSRESALPLGVAPGVGVALALLPTLAPAPCLCGAGLGAAALGAGVLDAVANAVPERKACALAATVALCDFAVDAYSDRIDFLRSGRLPAAVALEVFVFTLAVEAFALAAPPLELESDVDSFSRFTRLLLALREGSGCAGVREGAATGVCAGV